MVSDKVISFKEYGSKRENTEFVREFNLMHGQQPHLTLLNSKTGDQVHVNKGLLDQLMISDLDNGDSEESKFQFLAESDQLDIGETDF